MFIDISCWTQDQYETGTKASLVGDLSTQDLFFPTGFFLNCCPTDRLANGAFPFLDAASGLTTVGGYPCRKQQSPPLDRVGTEA